MLFGIINANIKLGHITAFWRSSSAVSYTHLIQRQGNRLIISHYLDSQGQSVPRSCASYCEKLEYQLLSKQTAILISRKQFPYK